ncbi:MAG: fumarate hydratase, partial [Clostridia bacterium]|nr:fumarate hydratase [Clostridia bacterium]
MREINVTQISEVIAKLCVEACCNLTPDLVQSFKDGKAKECSPVGCNIFDIMIENAEYAKESQIPACQDTGMAVCFLEIGQEVHLTGGDLAAAVDEGVRRGYVDGHLRLSVVSDPLRRVNSGDNTPAILHTKIVPGDKVKITVAPKG